MDIKTVHKKAEEIYSEYKIEKLKSAQIGDFIFFGEYEQDNDIDNGREDIEWLVLDKVENKILVVSKMGLDAKPYNDENKKVTWENCTLRTWLNEDFLNEAFDEKEHDIYNGAYYINVYGECRDVYIENNRIAVRPALWIDLDS